MLTVLESEALGGLTGIEQFVQCHRFEAALLAVPTAALVAFEKIAYVLAALETSIGSDAAMLADVFHRRVANTTAAVLIVMIAEATMFTKFVHAHEMILDRRWIHSADGRGRMHRCWYYHRYWCSG